MAIIIQQLWDIELGRPVRIADISKRKLRLAETVTHTDRYGSTHRYRLYTQPRNAQPYDKDTAHHKTWYKDNDEQPPFRLYKQTPTGQEVDLPYIAHQLYTKWGDGYFRGYFIGGYPPMEYFWQRRWLEKVI